MPSATPRQPRIRKSTPSVRERAEQAQAKADSPKPQRLKKTAAQAASPFKKVRLPDNSLTRPIKLVGRIIKKVLGWLMPKYFINSWREVRMVAWPSRKDTWRLTGAVFIFATVFGAMVAGIDKLLDLLFKNFVIK